jgi:hypothetical protein
LLSPSLPACAQSRMAVPSAPDCDMNAIGPPGGMPAEKEAFMGVVVSITPRQLGPMRRIPHVREISTNSRSRSSPSLPASRNPALMMIAAGMSFSQHIRNASGTSM